MTYHGANRLPESFELGELKIANTESLSELEPAAIVAFSGDKVAGQTPGSTSQLIVPNLEVPQYSRVNGIPNAVGYILSTINGLSLLLNAINLDGNGDKIVSVFTIPKFSVASILPSDNPQTGYPFVAISGSQFQSIITKTLSLTRPSSIDGYTPKNKKLLQYPFCYLGFNPKNGSQKIYRFENFTGTPSFDMMSEINPNPEVQFVPNNYRGVSGENLSENATLYGYPTLSYSNDVFNSWLAKNNEIISLNMQQEQLNFMLDAGTQLLKPIYGSLGGLGGSGKGKTSLLSSLGDIGSTGIETASGLMRSSVNYDYYVKNQIAQVEKQQLMPNQVSQGSSNATLVGYEKMGSQLFNTFTIRSEFANRIDKFFDMYGYLTNTLKLPNLNNRPNWNYVKTIGANITGSIPQMDLESIKEMFNNGVTLWHNPSTFLDYSQNNRT